MSSADSAHVHERGHRFDYRRWLYVVLCVLASGESWSATSTREIRFDIPRQPLASALRELSRQAQYQLLYSSDSIRSDIQRSLYGSYSVEQGLATILRGSGLEFVVNDRGSIAIRPERRERTVASSEATASAPDGSAKRQPDASLVREPTSLRPYPIAPAEVIVSARRYDSLQEMAAAVTALDDHDIGTRSIESMENLNARAPNVAVSGGNIYGRSNGSFRMRGVPGVAVYVDGVAHSGAAGLLMNVVELDRLEVLRGPQGTVFGRNAVGGAIHYITQTPKEQFGARVKATIGAFDRRDVTVNLDVPIGATVFTKLVAASLHRSGYVKSTTVNENLGSQDDAVARVDLLWRPNARFSALVVGEYTEQNSNGTPATVWALNPVCPEDPAPPNFVGTAPNSLCIYQAIGLSIDQGWVYGRGEQWKTGAGKTRGSTYSSQGPIVELNWTPTDEVTLKSITSYREMKSFFEHDFDGAPYDIFQSFAVTDRTESSQELQLLYRAERLSGVAGFYYYSDDNWSRRQNWVANELRFEPYLSARQAIGGAYAAYQPMINSNLIHARSEGWAVFSDWTYRVTDRLSVAVGARYNNDDISRAAYPSADSLPEKCCEPSGNLDPGGPALPHQAGSTTFTQTSPRASVQYQWTRNVMTYVAYAHGFGAGGFTGGSIPYLPDGGFSSYGPQALDSYELGLRSDLFGGRLRFNATYFRGGYDDIQISEEIQEAPGFLLTTNAGAAQIEGIETEGVWAPTDRLSFSYAASWLDTTFTDIGRARNLSLSSPFAYAPQFSYCVGVQHEWGLSHGGALTLRGDYSWQDDILTTLDVNTRSSQKAYGVLNARLAYRDSSGRWDISLFGNNLANQFYRINGFYVPADQLDTGSPGRPREWGVAVRFSMD